MDLFLFGFLSLLIGGLCAFLLPAPWKTRALLFFSFTALVLTLVAAIRLLLQDVWVR